VTILCNTFNIIRWILVINPRTSVANERELYPAVSTYAPYSFMNSPAYLSVYTPVFSKLISNATQVVRKFAKQGPLLRNPFVLCIEFAQIEKHTGKLKASIYFEIV